MKNEAILEHLRSLRNADLSTERRKIPYKESPFKQKYQDRKKDFFRYNLISNKVASFAREESPSAPRYTMASDIIRSARNSTVNSPAPSSHRAQGSISRNPKSRTIEMVDQSVNSSKLKNRYGLSRSPSFLPKVTEVNKAIFVQPEDRVSPLSSNPDVSVKLTEAQKNFARKKVRNLISTCIDEVNDTATTK